MGVGLCEFDSHHPHCKLRQECRSFLRIYLVIEKIAADPLQLSCLSIPSTVVLATLHRHCVYKISLIVDVSGFERSPAWNFPGSGTKTYSTVPENTVSHHWGTNQAFPVPASGFPLLFSLKKCVFESVYQFPLPFLLKSSVFALVFLFSLPLKWAICEKIYGLA